MKYIKHLWRIFLRRIPFEKDGTRCIAEVDLIHEPVDIQKIARQQRYPDSVPRTIAINN